MKIDLCAGGRLPDSLNCYELRINDVSGTWRIVYKVAVDAIVILEVFSKKTQPTPREVVDVCRKRLRQYEVT